MGTEGSAIAATSASPSAGLERVKQQDPIRAWRGIRLVASGHTVVLGSINGNGHGPLTVGEMQAVCTNTYSPVDYSASLVSGYLARGSHGVPHPDCTCGFYGVMDKAHCLGTVIAEADFYGTVIEHETGYRAEYQRILSLRINRQHCEGSFLCDRPAELLVFPPDLVHQSSSGMMYSASAVHVPSVSVTQVGPVPACRECALKYERVATLGQIAGRLGVEVRWDD